MVKQKDLGEKDRTENALSSQTVAKILCLTSRPAIPHNIQHFTMF